MLLSLANGQQLFIQQVVIVIEANKHDLFYRSIDGNKGLNFLHSNGGRIRFGKPVNAGTDIGECDGPDMVLGSQLQGIAITAG